MASILNVDKIRANGSTTDALIVNSSGQVSLPKTPYAIVNLSADATLTPGAIVPFDNVVSSQGISWNTSTYLFTVPISGLYLFSGAVRLNADRGFVYWQVFDSSGTAVQANKLVLSQGYSGVGFTTAMGSCLLSLSAGTNYKILVYDNSASSVVCAGSQTYMDIVLIG